MVGKGGGGGGKEVEGTHRSGQLGHDGVLLAPEVLELRRRRRELVACWAERARGRREAENKR